MRIFLFLAIFNIFFNSSCGLKFYKIDQSYFKNFLDIIYNYNSKNNQIKSTLDIKAYSLFGNFFHEKADIVIQNPNSFILSIRSFFGSPAIIFAFDGQKLTHIDYANLLEEEKNLFLLKNELTAYVIFNIIKAQIPVLKYNIKILESKNETIKISGKDDNETQYEGIFNYKKMILLNSHFINKNHNLNYKVEYEEHFLNQGTYFPKKCVINFNNRSLGAKLEVLFENISINEDSLPKETFILNP